MKRSLIFLLFCLFAGFFLASCTGSGPRPESTAVEVKPVWPPPPAKGRIFWQQEIKDFSDYRVRQGFWQRLGQLLAGRRKVQMVKPYGVYADDQGRFFVLDSGVRRLFMLDRSVGNFRMIPEGDENQLLSPVDLTGDEQGTIYITDSKQGKIFRYRLDDGQLAEFHTVALQRPTGIAFSPRFQQLYVADTLAQQVVVLGLDGQERFRFGSRGQEPGQFNAPTAISINRRGELLVTDALNSRVQVFSADGHFISQFGRPGDTSGTFAKPKGIAADSDGNIYVCDALFDAVQIFDRHGRLLLAFGNSGSQPGQFWMPAGIFIDNHDTIYVADTYNRRIQIFRYLKKEK